MPHTPERGGMPWHQQNMKVNNLFRQWRLPSLLAIAGLAFGTSSAIGATTNVTVGDTAFFSPKIVTINVNDSVKWTWAGTITHSSTGPGTPALWDSGLHSSGFTFTNKFTSAGSFPYRCVLHGGAPNFQTGLVAVVQAPINVPPT